MDYNTARDMASGFAGGGFLLAIYALKQVRFPKSLLVLNNALNYVQRYVESLVTEFPEEFQQRENKSGLVKLL